LTDNKHLEPADHIIPVIRNSVNSAAVAKALNGVSAKLTTDQISKLNLLVTGSQKEAPATVAQNWMKAEALSWWTPPRPPGCRRVGGGCRPAAVRSGAERRKSASTGPFAGSDR